MEARIRSETTLDNELDMIVKRFFVVMGPCGRARRTLLFSNVFQMSHRHTRICIVRRSVSGVIFSMGSNMKFLTGALGLVLLAMLCDRAILGS